MKNMVKTVFCRKQSLVPFDRPARNVHAAWDWRRRRHCMTDTSPGDIPKSEIVLHDAQVD